MYPLNHSEKLHREHATALLGRTRGLFVRYEKPPGAAIHMRAGELPVREWLGRGRHFIGFRGYSLRFRAFGGRIPVGGVFLG